MQCLVRVVFSKLHYDEIITIQCLFKKMIGSVLSNFQDFDQYCVQFFIDRSTIYMWTPQKKDYIYVELVPTQLFHVLTDNRELVVRVFSLALEIHINFMKFGESNGFASDLAAVGSRLLVPD